MKLFSKEIDKKLFKQYPKGEDLSSQVAVAKIFNPYGVGRWYLVNSDESDPDYIWAVVQMGNVVEVGSVSRKQLESLRIKPFNLPLERDLSFGGVNASELFKGLSAGKFYKAGGWTEGSENKEMLLNQAEGFEHHAEELESAVKKADYVPAWVVAKSQRASTDLSDITHYLDGENEQREEEMEGEEEYGNGGIVGGLTADESIYLYVKKAIVQKYREKYLKPAGLLGTPKSKYVEQSLIKKGFLNNAGAITELGKNKAREVDSEIGLMISRGYISSTNLPSKYKEIVEKFESDDKMASGGMMAKGGKTEPDETVYIEYFNKAKKFAKDKKEFTGQNAYNEAVSWGRKNIGNFNLDMVKFKMASGGMMAKGGEIELTNKDIFEKGKIKFYEFNGKVYANDRYKVIPHIKCKFLVEYKGKMYEVDGGVYEDGDIKISTSYQPVALSKSAFESKFEDSFEGGWQTISKYKPYKSKNDLLKSLKNDSLAFEGKMADGGMMSKIERMRLVKDRIDSKSKSKVYAGDMSKIERMRLVKDRIQSKSKNKMADGGMMAKGGIVAIEKKGDKKVATIIHNGNVFFVEYYIDNPEIKHIKGDDANTYFSVVDNKYSYGKSDKEYIAVTKKLINAIKNNKVAYYEEGGKMAMGGKVKFADKVKSIKASLLERKKVSPKVQKDYGKTYSPKEAEESAKRIVGAMTAKERLMAKRKKGKK